MSRVRYIRPTEKRPWKATTVRGYIPREKVRPEKVDFILRRRGPRRPAIERTIREVMDEYAAEQGIMGSLPEYIVHYELTRRGLRDGLHFDFQSSMMGGRLELGGAVADFRFLDRPLIIRVQGIYWHVPWEAMGLGVTDEEQRLLLEAMGFVVLDLWEDLIMDPDRLDDWMRRNIDQPVVRGVNVE